MLKKFHPPRPDWYEEFYASVMNSAAKDYEAEVFCSFFIFMDFFFQVILFWMVICFCYCIEFKFGVFPSQVAMYKSQIFSNLKGKGLRKIKKTTSLFEKKEKLTNIVSVTP